MSLDSWVALEQTPALLDAIAAESGDDLAVQKRLRNRFDADMVRLGLTLARLRKKADTKFAYASKMWFDGVRLEQATPEVVANHKAKRFHGEVVDLCCGLGADSIALARNAAVRAVDHDPLCGFFVPRNAQAYGVADKIRFECGTAESIGTNTLVHIDPDRRRDGRRVRRIEEYQPPLEFLQELVVSAPGGAINVSPAANFGGKFHGCEVELVSVAGECKEATVWFGDLATGVSSRATTLPTGESIAGEPLDAIADISDISTYLFDPDPALVRAGLVDLFCEQSGIARLDDAEEYLTAAAPIDSAFVTPFRVLDVGPNNKKSISKLLRSHDVGHVEVKTRHVQVDANQLQLKLASPDRPRAAVLFIARLQGRTHAVLAERMGAPDAP